MSLFFAKRPLDRAYLAIVSLSFIALGWPFLERMGIEADEALPGGGLYAPSGALFSLHVGGHAIPLMFLSYAGALKSWICAPVLSEWGAGAVTLRLPALLLGAATIPIFWLILREAHGRAAAWIGTLLLATDTSFLLLTTIDFGPVAIQIFLKCAIILLLLRWRKTGSRVKFAAAFFLIGLALWDKTLFLWSAAGMAAGALAAFPGETVRTLKPKLLAVAALAFSFGALPLIAYNIARPLDTFLSNARIAPADAFAKSVLLRRTMDGQALFGFYTALDTPPRPGNLDSGSSWLAARASVLSGSTAQNLTVWAFVISICAIPFLPGGPARRLAIFSVVAFAVGWFAMAITGGAGGAAHHVVLLWPLHFVVIAVLCAECQRHWSLPLSFILPAVLIAANLLVTGQYYRDLVRNGPAIRWTGAVNRLVDDLKGIRPERVFVVDWGILESINFLSEGTLPLGFANQYTAAAPSADEAALRDQMGLRGTVFVSHVDPYEQVAGVNAALQRFVARAHYHVRRRTVLDDDYGRPTFVVLQFER